MAKIRYDNIIAGDRLEVVLYPTHDKSGIKLSEGHSNKTSEQMQEENERKANKKWVRLVANNFNENDFIVSCEYNPRFAPANPKELHTDIYNFVRRVKYLRKKIGLSNKNFKYAFSIHCEKYKSGEKKGMNHYHFHGYMTGCEGLTIKDIKNLWRFGISGRVDYYDPEHYAPDAFAWYAATGSTKQKDSVNGRNNLPKGTRKFVNSQNCKPPKVEPKKDAKINKKKLEDLAKQRVDDRAYWEAKYPSYNFVKMDAVHNEINGYYYITVLMYKKRKNSYHEKYKKACTNFD